MKYKIMDGNEACSYVSYNFTEVAGIYPITPSSTMAELTDSWASNGKLNYFGSPVKVVEMQSEAGAAGMIHGSLQAGCLTTTYTASQGLLLMIPNMYKIAGELLPCVINVAARSIATHALSILGDHQDIYATRMTGFAHLASSSVQQVMDLTGVVHLAAIKGRVPFINFFDGFRTSHELQKVRLIDTDKLKDLIDQDSLDEFRKKALNPSHPVTRGTTQNDDIYFQATEVRNTYYEKLPDIVNDYMEEINKITGENYKPFNYYGSKVANRVIVAMGSVCETIREVVDTLNNNGEAVGLIEVHLYRPFSSKYLLDVLPYTVEKIAVLDRTKEPGSLGEPLYLDVVGVINNSGRNIKVIGGRYGLSSKNTTPSDINGVYSYLKDKECKHDFTVGIVDDITNKSINSVPIKVSDKSVEFLIYGYGSDGMVSACKDVMKITGDHTNAYVQGYFQYDSKKSGGVTKSHLRFSKELIHSTYYVERPSLVMCTKESYLKNFKMLDGIKHNGIFILNTDKDEKEALSLLSNHDYNILVSKNIKFYIIDAFKLAKEVGLDHKISSIMETVLFNVGHIMDFEFAKSKIIEDIEKKFANKGNDIVNKNIDAINKALDYLKLVEVPNNEKEEEEAETDDNIFGVISSGRGDSLKVSDFLKYEDGTYDAGLSKQEKRNISDIGPCFNKENCIQCNMCSFVCPHAVIRPFLLDEEEVKNAPESLKSELMDANIKGQNLKYAIGISLPDCTGCKLCVNICPGRKGEKALTIEKMEELKKTKGDAYEYLFNHVTEKKVMPITTVKGSQFVKPKFEFSGACSGCGETPYLKLLTQLFGDNLMISNATGCSSIYAASLPTTAYSVPWANSLFEDNAEYGFGMKIADKTIKNRICSLITDNIDKVDDKEKDIYNNYVEDINKDNANSLYEIIDKTAIPGLKELKEYIKPKSIWIVGGDGWAYDIGFSGIDHVLANHENVNILVLDTEVYSNTGGQSSKSSKVGSIAKFTAKGKEVAKKDLAKIALTYPHVYVGSIALGSNMQHTINVLKEAESYDGPSIVLAYAPCIAQGILTGMESTIQEEKKAVETGYYPLFHYNPETKEFKLDSKPDFNRYFEFIAGEDRYRMLKKINPDKYHELLEQNRINAIERYNYYVGLQEQSEKQKKEETNE
ncbi:MAG: pyruvate:ferredoxin (flavodoxin) oxidoreductase [Tenericutes bacterium]|nr:pyruvate:ferredoxin (flavodoxin) oxidoreductase [Mycoplasmatota bacterium]